MSKVSRREFLRTVAAAGVELSVSGAALAGATSRRKKIVVAGAGISGLCCAKFYSEDMLADCTVLKTLGFNDGESRFLGANSWNDLPRLFLQSHLGKFTDESRPLGAGHDDLDKISVAAFYKKPGASPTALRFLGGQDESALFTLWRFAVMGLRGIPRSSEMLLAVITALPLTA